MKMIIDISDELYNYMCSEQPYDKHLDKRFDCDIRYSVKKGIPLPKGHGDLVDKNTLEGHYVCSINLDGACVLQCDCKDCPSGVYQLYDDIDKIPIVVKADKESE